jgi:hypothetical protein
MDDVLGVITVIIQCAPRGKPDQLATFFPWTSYVRVQHVPHFPPIIGVHTFGKTFSK